MDYLSYLNRDELDSTENLERFKKIAAAALRRMVNIDLVLMTLDATDP